MDETKVTAQLPGLDIEVSRASLPNEQAEAILIRLKATPSFDAFGSWLAQPGMIPLALVATSLSLWTQLLGAFWQPWLALGPVRRREP